MTDLTEATEQMKAVGHQQRMVDALRRFATAIEELDETPQVPWHVDITVVIDKTDDVFDPVHTNRELMTFVDQLAEQIGLVRRAALQLDYPKAFYRAVDRTDAGTHEVCLWPRVTGATVNVDPEA